MIRVKPMIISCYVSGLRSCVLGVGAACLWCIQCGHCLGVCFQHNLVYHRAVRTLLENIPCR